MDLADIKICKTLIINIVYFADSLNSYHFLMKSPNNTKDLPYS